MAEGVSATKIVVTQPDGRDIEYITPYWRREKENILVIDSPEDPKDGERRAILAIHRMWWSFRLVPAK